MKRPMNPLRMLTTHERINEMTDFFSNLPGWKTKFDPNSIKFDAIREISKIVNNLNREDD